MISKLVFIGPIIALILIIRFRATSNPAQRRAVFMAWLFPGLGHLVSGDKKRGLILGGMVFLTFIVGMAMADFRNISPFDRHPIWAFAHAFGGLMSGGASLLTEGLKIESDNALYQAGCLYSGAACLLNILLMIDAFDRNKGTVTEAATADPVSAAPGLATEEPQA